MRNPATKISLFILIALIISACNSLKRVPDGKQLLTKNEILVNGKKEKSEDVTNQLYQKQNSKFLGYRLRLGIFNLARTNPDSIYKAKFIKNPAKYKRMSKWLSKKQVDRLGHSFWYSGMHNFLKRTGEPPAILNKKSVEKSLLRLKSYYFNNGYFNASTTYKIDTLSLKKVKIKYAVTTGIPFFLDTINTKISTPVLDSLYKKNKQLSLLKKGKQYDEDDFNSERNRITTHFRNNGAFYFQPNYINYNIDTLITSKKANVDVIINNQPFKDGDSTKTAPFKLYKISEVNIFTDTKSKKDSGTTYKNFNLFSKSKLKYRPKAITDAVFIAKGSLFSDNNNTLTSRYITNLKVFNYPSIQYHLDTRDSTSNSLIADIYLSPKKKYIILPAFDFTHSSIQEFGITGSTSLSIRNIFRGAETLEIGLRGNIGSSNEVANPNNLFFNVSEYGTDLKLNFPRILFPLRTEKIIPKSMIPSTTLNLGFSKQNNIGLDKENFTGAMSYNWKPRKTIFGRFDLFNVLYVKNINTGNYFNIYKSSYNQLNALASTYPVNSEYFDANNNLIIESGTNGFINDVFSDPDSYSAIDYKTIKSIQERRQRLTENNLILATNYSYSESTKTDLSDNSYFAFKAKIESAGNLLSLLGNFSEQLKNSDGKNVIFGVEYSQYAKTEFEYIKHWDLRQKKTLAIRGFAGIAIPYGNSDNIPFSRSYFAGGSNDNRGWQPYALGPGSSGGVNDFNEANMKLAFSAELRFNIFQSLNGALFVDAGNIWNIFDDIEDDRSVFLGLKSLQNSAIGSGFGFRYDFNFFVVRLDLGFKTYNPTYGVQKKWFRDYNFNHSVINIGINYPF